MEVKQLCRGNSLPLSGCAHCYTQLIKAPVHRDHHKKKKIKKNYREFRIKQTDVMKLFIFFFAELRGLRVKDK